MLLSKATENTNIALTLTEKSTLENPIYLFAFINKATGVEYTCISPDLASAAQKQRTNLFTITEGVDDRENGSLILGYAGQYRYLIYEQVSTTNLDPDNAVNIVERGEMRLIDDTDNESKYIEYNYSDTYIEYE